MTNLSSKLYKVMPVFAIFSMLCVVPLQANETSDKEISIDAPLSPSANFNLISWNLSIPTDEDGNTKADTIKELALVEGYTNPSFFYAKPDGGMTFIAPINGVKTSKNTKYVRTELREMLRKGDTQHSTKGVGPNNWVLSSASAEDQKNAGAVDGRLTGTLSVDHVTTSGNEKQVGRVVFAQIHGKKDVPVRLYYRKLPNNSKGSIYFSHEPSGEKDIYFDLVGSRSSNANNPEDGISLGEKFSYEISTKGNELSVSLIREGEQTITKKVDMSNSGYNLPGQYVYFKVGAYLQDNSANKDDYAQTTYYKLQNWH